MTSSEGRERQRFTIDLPDQEAALALAGQGEIMLRRLSDLTGANLVLRRKTPAAWAAAPRE